MAHNALYTEGTSVCAAMSVRFSAVRDSIQAIGGMEDDRASLGQ